MKEPDILDLIRADARRMAALRAVRSLDLPDWWIGAGFVRAAVWDALHGYAEPTPLPDIDIAYFDPEDLSEETEERHQARLDAILPGPQWSATNQARMHEWNGDLPYASTLDAIAHWPETATCVAVRMDARGELELGAPHGIADLVGLIVRPSPAFAPRTELFAARIAKKGWARIWPKLGFMDR